MKKLLFTVLIPILTLSASTSCGGNSSKGGSGKDSITFDSIKVDSTLWLTEDTAGPRCHVRLSLTFAEGKNADYINDSIIRSGILSPDYFSITSQKLTAAEAADSFVSRYLSEYKATYGELYKIDRSHGVSYNCEYLVSTYVLQDNDKYYTYMANVYNYGGGAHGNSVVIARNIDTATGKIVSLKDIFVPGYELELNDIIVEALCKKYEVKDLSGLHDKTIFMGIDVYPSENFIIGEKSMTFIYSPDEIASHAVGEIRVEIKNKELERLLRK